MNKKIIPVIILVVVLIGVMVGFLGYRYFIKKENLAPKGPGNLSTLETDKILASEKEKKLEIINKGCAEKSCNETQRLFITAVVLQDESLCNDLSNLTDEGPQCVCKNIVAFLNTHEGAGKKSSVDNAKDFESMAKAIDQIISDPATAFIEEKCNPESSSSDSLPPRSGGYAIAADARIKSNLLQLRIMAELYFNNGDSYAGIFCDSGDFKTLCESIKKDAGVEPAIYSSKKEYCAYVMLRAIKEGRDSYFCVDSRGFTKESLVNPASSGYCDGKTFVCPAE